MDGKPVSHKFTLFARLGINKHGKRGRQARNLVSASPDLMKRIEQRTSSLATVASVEPWTQSGFSKPRKQKKKRPIPWGELLLYPLPPNHAVSGSWASQCLLVASQNDSNQGLFLRDPYIIHLNIAW